MKRRALPIAFFAFFLVAGGGGCMSFNTVQLWPFGEKMPLQPFPVGGDEDARDIVVLVDVQGLIVDADEKGLLGLAGIENTVAQVRAVLDKTRELKRLKALLLRINTPGGTVTASDLIYHEVMKFRAENPQIPVYAMMMDMATSGGYYVAVSARKIWAHPTTVTGSIGVVVPGINLAGLFDKIGVEDQTVKSGKHKDMLSPLRKQTEDDRRLMQQVVDSLYEKFLDRVKQGRPDVPESKLRAIADGRILVAEEARKAGLIDEIGYFDDVLDALRVETGVPKLRVVVFRNREEADDNLYVAARSGGQAQGLLRPAWEGLLTGRLPGGSPFFYVWPGALGLSY